MNRHRAFKQPEPVVQGPRNRQSPGATALSPRLLVRAAWMAGRGFPTDDVAERLQCCPRKLATELNRLGVDRAPPPRAAGPDTIEVQVKLSRDERTVLGTASLDHCMYQPAVLQVLMRAVLGQGRPAVDRLLRDGGAR